MPIDSMSKKLTQIPINAANNAVNVKTKDDRVKNPERRGLGEISKSKNENPLVNILSNETINRILNGGKGESVLKAGYNLIESLDSIDTDSDSLQSFYTKKAQNAILALKDALTTKHETQIKNDSISNEVKAKIKSVKDYIGNDKIKQIALDVYNLRSSALNLPQSVDHHGSKLYIQPEIQARIGLAQEALGDLRQLKNNQAPYAQTQSLSRYATNIWDFCRDGNLSEQKDFINNFIDLENIKTERDLNTLCCGIATARVNATSQLEKNVADALIEKLAGIKFENDQLNATLKINMESINDFISGIESSKNDKKSQFLEESERIVRNRTGDKEFKF